MVQKEKVPYFLKFSLASLRVRKGLTQKEAAEMLGMTRNTLRGYEKDSSQLDYQTIKKIEKIYKVPQDYIFFGKSTALSVILEKEEPDE